VQLSAVRAAVRIALLQAAGTPDWADTQGWAGTRAGEHTDPAVSGADKPVLSVARTVVGAHMQPAALHVFSWGPLLGLS